MSAIAEMQSDGDRAFFRVDTFRPSHELEAGVAAEAVNKRFEDGRAWPRHGVLCQPWGQPKVNSALRLQVPRGYARFNDPNGVDNLVQVTDDRRDGSGEDGGRGRAWRILSGNAPQPVPLNGHDVYGEARLIPCYNGLVLLRQDLERHYFSAAAVNFSTSQIQLNCLPNWASGEAVLYWADPDSYITGASPPNANTLYYVKNITGNKIELYTDAALTTKLSFTGGTSLGTFYLERRAANPGFFGNGAPPLLMQPDGSGKTAFEVGFLAVPASVAASAFDAASKILTVANHRLIPGDKITYVHFAAAPENFYVSPASNDGVRLYTTLDLALANGLATAQTPAPAQTSGDVIKKADASGLAMPPGREGVYLPNGRLVIVNGRNNLAISDPLDPLHFTPFQATLNANLGESDVVSSLIPLGVDPNARDIVIVGKENSVLALLGLSGPSSGWQLKEVTREYGFGAALATLIAGTDAWGFSRKGVVSVNQTTQSAVLGVALPVSRAMKKYLEMVDWTHFRQATAATWNNRYFLAVPLKGQGPDAPAHAITLVNGRTGQAAVLLGTDPALMSFDQNYVLEPGQVLRVAADAYIGQQTALPVAIPGGINFRGIITITGSSSYTFTARQSPVKNNGVLVYNFLTEGWEGLWQGAALEVYCFARHYVYGEERLTFLNYDGQVCWLGDGYTDPVGAPISDRLVTRTYTGRERLQGPKLWLKGRAVWDTQQPKLTVRARAPGYNEEQVLLQDKEYDRTKYLAYGSADYDPGTSTPAAFDAPNREDYSLAPGELLAGTLDAHQNVPEALRLRVNDWGLQIVIENAQGSARVQSVELEFVPLKRVASRMT